jgi:alpha-galactosidase
MYACLRTALAVLIVLAAAAPASARQRALSPTPPMGWNSWYAYHCDVTEGDVLANAHALVDSGMKRAGYRYVNVDGCWEAPARDANGDLQANPQTFPSGMRALGQKIHALGLRFGIYTSAGRTICLHDNPGSYNHYARDFRRFASWGVDYVKVDWCNPAPGQHLKTAYPRVARAARHAGRRMIVTVSTPGISKPWRWAPPYGSSWRIAPDLSGSWSDLLRVVDVDAPLWRHGGPGGWNDADILQVGNGVLTADEERAQFSLWSMLASPLLAGNPLPSMSAATRSVLTNRSVIAVSQDRRGRQARRVRRSGGREWWVKPLARRGCAAVLALDRDAAAHTMTASLRGLAGVPHARRYSLRDLWRKRSSRSHGRLSLRVPSHGVRMLRACAS